MHVSVVLTVIRLLKVYEFKTQKYNYMYFKFVRSHKLYKPL